MNVVRVAQPLNAPLPMLVTDDGMVIDVIDETPLNAYAPMLLYVAIRTLVAPYNNAVASDNTPLPLNTLVIHDTLTSDAPYNVLVPGVIPRPSNSMDSSKTAVVIPELWNALLPMLLTEDGIVIDVIPLAPWKALVPMLLTEDGIVTDVKLVARKNALAPMIVTESGILYNVRGLPLGY